MSWVQFHFKCRYFLQKTNEGLTLQQAKKSFEKSSLDTLYSEKDLTGIQKELFDRIFHLPNINDVKRALKIFSSINLAESLASSKAYKSITNKLSYLEVITAVFITFITIYKLFVYPVFSELIQQYPALGGDFFGLIPSMWLLGITVSVLTFMFTFSYRKYIKNIDSFVINLPNKNLKFIIPKNVLVEITKLNKIITMALNKKGSRDSFYNKLDAINEMGLDESIELASLFKHQAEKLETIIWQHSKRTFGFMYSLVTLGIAFYIIQIYDPIFKIGVVLG